MNLCRSYITTIEFLHNGAAVIENSYMYIKKKLVSSYSQSEKKIIT